MHKLNTLKQHFRTILQVPELKTKLEKFMGIELKTKDAVEAFSLSMKKNFSPIPKDWAIDDKIVSKYEGAKILDKWMTINTFTKYVSLGYFRSTEDGKVYSEEIKKYKDICLYTDELYDKHILEKTKEYGTNRIFLFPASVNKLKLSDHNQKIKSALYVAKQKWFQDTLELIDFEV